MAHLDTYVGLVHHSERILAEGFRTVGQGHAAEVDVFHMCGTLARWSEEHVEALRPVVERYGERDSGDDVDEPDRLLADSLGSAREGSVGLLRDLQDLFMLASFVQTTWTALLQGGQGARDHELIDLAARASGETSRQLAWITTRLKSAAPEALLMTP